MNGRADCKENEGPRDKPAATKIPKTRKNKFKRTGLKTGHYNGEADNYDAAALRSAGWYWPGTARMAMARRFQALMVVMA